MQKKTIIFDMDGTLMDSGIGLMDSVKATLSHFGMPEPDEKALRAFVGPPIRIGLQLYGFPKDRLEEAMVFCRTQYSTINRYKTAPYKGIDTLLGTLKQQGYLLCVATSKPQDLTDDILEKFNLAGYFDFICGADWSAHRDTKDAVIRFLLQKLEADAQCLMVGDTVFDVSGAAAHGIPTIGVAWGYGTPEDLLGAGALAVASDSNQLLHLIQES